MTEKILVLLVFFSSILPLRAWTYGELLVWINSDKAYSGLTQIGQDFQKHVGVTVTVEHPKNIVDRFQTMAKGERGPDIIFWAHDRIGEWANAGLLRSIIVPNGVKDGFLPMVWQAVTHGQEIFGYPLALEAVSLIYNKKYVTGKPPTQLDELAAFARDLKTKHQDVIAVMWDYNTPYFSWPFLAGGGGYSFRKTPTGYDTKNVGVANPGAVRGLEEIVNLIASGVMPRGATYEIMEREMQKNDLAMMIAGPWVWADLRKSGIDFGVAPLPGVDGHPSRPFVGVLAGMISHSSPNSDLATHFLEDYVCSESGMRTLDADAELGVPALKKIYDEMAVEKPLIRATYESVQAGEVMPNVPSMGRFWSAMTSALRIATNGQASPETALAEARRNIEQ